MKICGMEFGEKTISKIKELIGTGITRTRLSQEAYLTDSGLDEPGRKLKEMSCRIALWTLHDKGSTGIPEVGPEPVSGLLSDLGTIELQRVEQGDNGWSFSPSPPGSGRRRRWSGPCNGSPRAWTSPSNPHSALLYNDKNYFPDPGLFEKTLVLPSFTEPRRSP